MINATSLPTSELISQAKEIILISDMSVELRNIMKRSVIYEEEEEEYEEVNQENESGVNLDMELIMNEVYPVLEDFGSHERRSAEDPFMQVPDQEAYAEMTAKVTRETGALPIPVTTLSSLPKDSVLVHWDESGIVPTVGAKEKDG